MSSNERVYVPHQWDILFGRTDESINHVGNVAFRTLVAISLAEYYALPQHSRADRHGFLVSIVASIKRGTGLFLLKNNDEGGWVEVSDEKAREKVRQQYHNSLKKPHIVEAFTADTLAILPFFRSTSDFDWRAMVEACDRYLHPRVAVVLTERNECIEETNFEKRVGDDFDTLMGDIFEDLNATSFVENKKLKFDFSHEIEGTALVPHIAVDKEMGTAKAPCKSTNFSSMTEVWEQGLHSIALDLGNNEEEDEALNNTETSIDNDFDVLMGNLFQGLTSTGL